MFVYIGLRLCNCILETQTCLGAIKIWGGIILNPCRAWTVNQLTELRPHPRVKNDLYNWSRKILESHPAH